MKCFKCGGRLHVVDTVHNASSNEIYRKRRCKSCVSIFYTVEFEVNYDQQVQKIWNENHRKAIERNTKKCKNI